MKTQSKSSKPSKPKKPAKPKKSELPIKDRGEFPTAQQFAQISIGHRKFEKLGQGQGHSQPRNLPQLITDGRAKARGIEVAKKTLNGDPVEKIKSKLSNDLVPLKGARGVCGPFKIAKYIVTMGEWNATAAWARKKKGYKDFEVRDVTKDTGGTGKNYPKRNVSLREAAMWCNAKSEQEGLDPCYYLGGKVFRTKPKTSAKIFLDWKPEKNGYRLPTLMEWRFAYGSHNEKDLENLKGFIAPHGYGQEIYCEVGISAPNHNGIYDLSKLVRQWVWDFYIDLEEESEISSALGTSNSKEPNFDELTKGEYSTGAIGFRLARNSK